MEPPSLGETITIEYGGYTSGGLPKFARFLRVRALKSEDRAVLHSSDS
ncbi:hypothetical protein P7F88_19060 [Vibrio hannami]|nr:hypothetical protein [Vibrio hannami]MDG3088060.1 hypothetical protein [Vibrio hannami]